MEQVPLWRNTICAFGILVIPSAFAQTVFINEIHYDNQGPDQNEGVEIAGPAGTDVTGWMIFPYDGSTGQFYGPFGQFSGLLPDQQNGFGTALTLINGLQDGPDAIALVNNTGTVLQFLSYEGSFIATTGPAAGMTSTNIGVAESGIDPPGNSLQLEGTGAQFNDFQFGSTTHPHLWSQGPSVNQNQTFAQPPLDCNGVPNGPAMPGAPCDDGDACTLGDVLGADCVCHGTPMDCSDGDPCTFDYCFLDGICQHIFWDDDEDGICNTFDGCPDDPNKTGPGLCGCGVADTDSDGDGAPDCNDGCPGDPEKTAPGICGCGVSDADGDGDGTPNCNDGCPGDPFKTSPGLCGCGISDGDTDGDDIPDCIEGSFGTDPNNPDTDGDGVLDGDELDGGTDPLDPDTDNDGTTDGLDDCPADPNKTSPGVCGCGVPDTDTDGDGAADCQDQCDQDPDKTAPGICGCGVPDADTDSDGLLDCIENLIGTNPLDSDSDDDGVNDGPEVFDGDGTDPLDPDSDDDGTIDGQDLCPNDPNKVAPGICGCGVPDIDTDGDGIMDCLDGCPNNPFKTAPGICGCDYAEPGTTCDDGDICTVNDVVDGNCNCHGSPPNCDDGNPCSWDACNVANGECVHVFPPCNDYGPCVIYGYDANCNCTYAPVICPDDGDPCTYDACDQNGDCVHIGLGDADGDGLDNVCDPCPDLPGVSPGDPCDDESLCTTGDMIDGACNCSGTLINCDDGDPCTADGCLPSIGCIHFPGPDADEDGTCDEFDGCPDDPNKTSPGICGCGVSDADSDGDGAVDCNDGCPGDPNKTAPGICGCGQADVDGDGDGYLNCLEECPGDPNKQSPGLCGCGVSDVDSDGDIVPDCGDGCPGDPEKIDPGVCGCGVPDTDTDGDLMEDCLESANGTDPNDPDTDDDGVGDGEEADGGTNPLDPDSDDDGVLDDDDDCPLDPYKTSPGICGCGVPDTDTDGDGAMDCQDGCPYDPEKTAPGICGCNYPDNDADGDGVMNCIDGCPTDPLKTAPGFCGCNHPEVPTDSDGDGIPNCGDNCPNVAGQIGSACNDGNPNTGSDKIGPDCVCRGQHISKAVMTTSLDGAPGETAWSITLISGSPDPFVCSGGGTGAPPNSTASSECDLFDGCYLLSYQDSDGDGMCCANGNGGYVLALEDGRRIIDNANNGIFTNTSSVTEGFCLPIGNDAMVATSCDQETLQYTSVLQAAFNPAVTAQYGASNSTSGYQFWIFNPNGGYARKIFQSHAAPGAAWPSGTHPSQRAAYLRLSAMVTSPVPPNVLLNIRVRSRVNGVYSEYGPACRMKIDTYTNCSTTRLTTTATPVISCGATGIPVSNSIYANAVSGATNYQFEFSKPGYLRRITSPVRSVALNFVTSPLQYNNCYAVRVRVSFDSGSTWCPFGLSCNVTVGTALCGSFSAQDDHGDDRSGTVIQVWPNPNHGEELHISVARQDGSTITARLTIYDQLGRQVADMPITVEGKAFSTRIAVDRSLPAGMYLVLLTDGARSATTRLVIA